MSNFFEALNINTKLESIDEINQNNENIINDNNNDDDDKSNTKRKRTRKVERNAKRKSAEQVAFIVMNYKNKTVAELMKEPILEGLTEQQIRKTITDIRMALKELINEINDNNKKEKLLKWIDENLPNRRDASGFKGPRGSVYDLILDKIKEEILNN